MSLFDCTGNPIYIIIQISANGIHNFIACCCFPRSYVGSGCQYTSLTVCVILFHNSNVSFIFPLFKNKFKINEIQVAVINNLNKKL